MNHKKLLFLLLLSPCISLAEVGDVHIVKGDNAVVRDGPGDSAAQVDKLASGTEIMEMAVEGEWFEIYVADTDLTGWMKKADLELQAGGDAATVASEAASTPAATAETSGPVPAAPSAAAKITVTSSGEKTAALNEFEKYLVRYNARTNVLKGYIPYLGAEDRGNGELYVTVSNKWLEKSKGRQKSSIITLYTKWKRMNSNSGVRVYAQDQSGNPIVQYPK